MRTPKEGWIYIVGALDIQTSPLMKIGMTLVKEQYGRTGPVNRVRDLQSGCPIKLRLLHCSYVPRARAWEKAIHKHYRHQQVHGEWFRLNGQQYAYLVSRLQTIEEEAFGESQS